MLGRRDHSEKELRDKLTRYYSLEDVELALKRARDEKWLRPPEDLARVVSEGLSRRGKGRLRIDAELKKRGLPRVTLSSEHEVQSARHLILKLVKQSDFASGVLGQEVKAKIYRRLSYRGFTTDIIGAAIKDILEAVDENN